MDYRWHPPNGFIMAVYQFMRLKEKRDGGDI